MDDLAKVAYEAYVEAKVGQYNSADGGDHVLLSDHIDTLNPWETLSHAEQGVWDAVWDAVAQKVLESLRGLAQEVLNGQLVTYS